MNKQKMLSDLFDQTVRHAKEPNDDVNRELLKSNKFECVIHWPEETREVVAKALLYVARQKGVVV